MLTKYPIIYNKTPKLSNDFIEIKFPYNGEIIANQSLAQDHDLDEVLENISHAFERACKMSIAERKSALQSIIEGLKDSFEELARTISLEAGKPIKDSRLEVNRAINVFCHSLSICEHIKGEIIDLSSNPGSEKRIGYVHYVPVGPILAITPFNFPLNLTAHKIAPAIAIGCPVIHRPSSKTPLSGYYLAKIIAETKLPDYFYSFLPSKTALVDRIINSRKVKKLSFTGSPETGWKLKAKANFMKATLELGGNASCIVSSDADVNNAVSRCIKGAFSYSGQVCISIQKIHIHRKIYDEFAEKFIYEAGRLNYGNPLDENTQIGPIINTESFKRIRKFINEASLKGAEMLLEPSYHGNIITPFVFSNTSTDMLIEREELFGPGVIFHIYDNIEETIDMINSSKYGLQTGIFSNDMREINYVFDRIDTGGLIVNDIPTFRSDSMPYGGVKESGFGREGIMYAVKDMLEPKLMVISRN